MNEKIVKRKRYKKANLLKDINVNNYNLFEFSAERLISSLKLSIVKIKSQKDTLFNNDLEENSSENRTAGLTMESSQDKLKELEIPNNSPTFEKNNENLSNPSSLINKFQNKKYSNNMYSNEPTLKNISSIKNYDEDDPFYNGNKFVIDDNFRSSQYGENDLCFENSFNFSSSPNKNLNLYDYYYSNNQNHEFEDVNNI